MIITEFSFSEKTTIYRWCRRRDDAGLVLVRSGATAAGELKDVLTPVVETRRPDVPLTAVICQIRHLDIALLQRLTQEHAPYARHTI